MARRQAFVYRHPFATLAIIVAVELTLVATLHLVLGWSPLTIVMVGLVALILVVILMG